mgnify:CR=1 FL=1
MPVNKREERLLNQMMAGVQRRTMLWGDAMLLAEIHLEPGGVVPLHDHPYEQIGYCIEGTFDFDIGEETHHIEAGASWVVPSNVPHKAAATSKCFLIEVWSPARDDYKN